MDSFAQHLCTPSTRVFILVMRLPAEREYMQPQCTEIKSRDNKSSEKTLIFVAPLRSSNDERIIDASGFKLDVERLDTVLSQSGDFNVNALDLSDLTDEFKALGFELEAFCKELPGV